jgi:hypothetical protein
MSDPSETPRPISPDDLLPPVEAPSAGFIVQLFVVPLLIVLAIVMVYLMFHWLAHMGSGDPRKYVDEMRAGGANSFQAAHDFATELTRNPALKRDGELAAEVSRLLDRELESDRLDDESLKLRYYLAKTLGEFQTPAGLPTLLKMAGDRRGESTTVDNDFSVARLRGAAIESIAVLVDGVRRANSGPTIESAAPDLPVQLVALSRDDTAAIRQAAAFALGVAGGDEATAALGRMLTDADPDTRYNAALGLARHGDARCQEVLVEMLNPDELPAGVLTEHESARDYKRSQVVLNALRAAAQLAAANPRADLRELRALVDRLDQAPLNPQIRMELRQLRDQLGLTEPAAAR